MLVDSEDLTLHIAPRESVSSLVQDNTQERSVDMETAIVPNEAQFLEFIHEEIDA